MEKPSTSGWFKPTPSLGNPETPQWQSSGSSAWHLAHISTCQPSSFLEDQHLKQTNGLRETDETWCFRCQGVWLFIWILCWFPNPCSSNPQVCKVLQSREDLHLQFYPLKSKVIVADSLLVARKLRWTPEMNLWKIWFPTVNFCSANRNHQNIRLIQVTATHQLRLACGLAGNGPEVASSTRIGGLDISKEYFLGTTWGFHQQQVTISPRTNSRLSFITIQHVFFFQGRIASKTKRARAGSRSPSNVAIIHLLPGWGAHPTLDLGPWKTTRSKAGFTTWFL